MKKIKPVFPYLKPYLKQLIVGPTFKLAEAILELLLPLLMAQLLDSAQAGATSAEIWKQAAVMLLIAVVGLGCALICQYYAAIASQGYGTALRRAVFDKVTSLDAAAIDLLGESSLVTRVTDDTYKLQNAVAMFIRLVVRAPFLCIGASIMAIIINPKLSLIIIILIVLYILVLWLVLFRTVPLSLKVREKLDKVLRMLRENLSGVRVVRAFGQQKRQNEAFEQAATEHASENERVGIISAVLAPATTLLMNLAIALLVWQGAGQAFEGELSKGDLVALVNYITQIVAQMLIIARLVIQYTQAYSSAQRVSEALTAESQVTSPENPAPFPEKCAEGVAAIEFDNVTLCYPRAVEPSLENITLRVEPGQTLGIIGATGSGKSTLAKLLMREYDPTEGSVRIFGEDIRTYSLEDLRNAVAFVPQKAVLLSGSVAQNIRHGNAHASDEEMRTAARIAQADEFIEKMEGGYLAHIERGGSNLSGGQRQRMTIARALARGKEKMRLLVLDDSTSALDALTDSRLRKGIREELGDVTVVIVAQRVRAIRDADIIVMLDEGRAVGIGTHDELMRSCEEYAEIANTQESA